jgi:chorismate--pyruvate lyase
MSAAAHGGWSPRVPPQAGAFRQWLFDRGSLTLRLQERCQRFRVQPTRQTLAQACLDERPLLGLRTRELAVVREVFLLCDGVPVVFAHSVVRVQGLRGGWHWLGRLGARPLGAALFADPRVQRLPLAFRAMGPRHPLFTRATATTGSVRRRLWARRSPFLLEGIPLLVTEVFLPGILELPR